MKLTNAQVLDLQQVLNLITPQPELRVAAAFNLRKLNKLLQSEVELIEEMRIELLQKYADKDKEGNPVTKELGEGTKRYELSEKGMKEFSKEFEELMSQARDLELPSFSIGALGDIKISVNALDKLIELGIVNES